MKQALYNRRLLDVIKIISANRESGRLKIQVRTTMGYVFFKEGKLVDAHMGALTGFPAINAAASIREADFSFDPSIEAPPLSLITPNERIVLKQLFGIETVEPQAGNHQVSEIVDDLPPSSLEAQPTEEIHGLPEEETRGLIEDDSEVTLVTGREQAPQLQRITSAPLPPPPPSYRRSLYVAILLVLMGAASVALLLKSDNESSPMSVANPSLSSSLPPITDAGNHIERKDSAPNKPSESSSLPTVTDAGKKIEQESPASQDLSGRWTIVNVVEKTSYRSFTDMKIGFRLRIKQTGQNFTAEGQKLSENGRMLAVAARTPIRMTGSIDGERVQATFIEDGTRRKTSGRFVWRINKAGSGLTGTFVSGAAKSSGKSQATKEL